MHGMYVKKIISVSAASEITQFKYCVIQIQNTNNKKKNTAKMHSVHILILFTFPFVILRSLSQHSLITTFVFLSLSYSFLLVAI